MPHDAGAASARCSAAVSAEEDEEDQCLAPDPSPPRARDARGRFAAAHSGNPRGRPPGIRNPRRRVPDLIARPLSPQALSELLDRKPDLLRPLAEQLLPPVRARLDPAERLGIDLSSLRRADEFRPPLLAVLRAVSRGEITPGEAARIARRVRVRLRGLRRLARQERASRGASDP